VFIDWPARTRRLKAATISSYLAGVRQLHVMTGAELPNLRGSLNKLVLKGIKNKDGIEKRSSGETGRLPITINMMLILKNTIASSELNKHDKRLLWAVSTMAFARAFRGGEILSKHEATYDPDFTFTFCTDSTICLYWITQDDRPLQTGVRNAVTEIR
jgi:hypothetical protein